MQKISQIILVAALFVSTACVHTSVERTGRMRLVGGQEGSAPIMAVVSSDYEEVAVVTVATDSLSDSSRLTRHLQRRASLLGCDAITQVEVSTKSASASCVKVSEPVVAKSQEAKEVRQASPELLSKLVNSGAAGQGLAEMLVSLNNRTSKERAWSINWFLKNYPESPFRSDVESLFVAPSQAVASLSASAARTAPTVH